MVRHRLGQSAGSVINVSENGNNSFVIPSQFLTCPPSNPKVRICDPGCNAHETSMRNSERIRPLMWPAQKRHLHAACSGRTRLRNVDNAKKGKRYDSARHNARKNSISAVPHKGGSNATAENVKSERNSKSTHIARTCWPASYENPGATSRVDLNQYGDVVSGWQKPCIAKNNKRLHSR